MAADAGSRVAGRSLALNAAMRIHQDALETASRGRGTHDVTGDVAAIVAASGIERGLATVFVHHTSASLIVCENADPTVRRDLEAWLARAVPDGDPLFRHVAEGPDDMPAHVRSALTQTSIAIPVCAGRLDLGTWQGLYLYEHRRAPHVRRVSVTVIGD
jgi:secondary thiamine-phosphate synthase enzyme